MTIIGDGEPHVLSATCPGCRRDSDTNTAAVINCIDAIAEQIRDQLADFTRDGFDFGIALDGGLGNDVLVPQL
jgi:hypothetical protein